MTSMRARFDSWTKEFDQMQIGTRETRDATRSCARTKNHASRRSRGVEGIMNCVVRCLTHAEQS
ncbi:MAG: hypothetical protein DWH97_09885 [Planctomycetota bacterium]|nr:MAG: hypothetical protein DWH97_09885 [Planctomycetota bacterium]RLS91593.1 MAG: hypothetical protein DWI12_12985 [Planctomycetota bacterium]